MISETGGSSKSAFAQRAKLLEFSRDYRGPRLVRWSLIHSEVTVTPKRLITTNLRWLPSPATPKIVNAKANPSVNVTSQKKSDPEEVAQSKAYIKPLKHKGFASKLQESLPVLQLLDLRYLFCFLVRHHAGRNGDRS